ncbi:phosphomannomutase/phosphoglucomutase [Pseudoclavibacter chungangensis]|uniref:Phosphomannomutase/phosphoglucomutase n=1 Tax=Pseudoclavibacter chungangensis TaxID=587635 RepID=A0A7J5BYS9_9MICO|nr:phosphomannomutase/phosphoglucomutase [Pseudoclavibacter chungangensis]KAB1659492.1 phosphomannomutase/phosphoglucomutase [Pseudoclavibacter chungangensis]NYJ67650.1 phosphomannomutase [Pseudoclavibacter chungangensis]
MTSEVIPAANAAERGALAEVVKTYDVRGLVGSQLTEPLVTAIGAAVVDELDLEGGSIAIGHDMRPSSPAFAAAFARGARQRGAEAVHLGLCSTDESYYASGSRDVATVMFTASHNPAEYNGLKLCRAGAKALSLDTGLGAIRDRAAAYLDAGIPAVRSGVGAERRVDLLPDYAAFLRSLVDLRGIRPLRVVVDAGNGMAGLTVPAVLGDAAGLGPLPLEIVPLYFRLDGTFPNHEANPLDPANLVDLQRAVVEHDADLGLAFDGDADRCFVVDERGEPVSPSAVTAIVARREIVRARAAGEEHPTVLHNLITSRHVPEAIEAVGAKPVRTRVGHSLIKAVMARTNAVFGGEHSAHYYFREFWGADNGLLAAMHVLAEAGADGVRVSALSRRETPYAASGEINSAVDDVPGAYARLFDAFDHRGDYEEFDGLTFRSHTSGSDGWWWFNVRASNTEPLLRLNVEASDAHLMGAIRDEALGIIRQEHHR